MESRARHSIRDNKGRITRDHKKHHFKRGKPLRSVCDASKEGLGAVLQQETVEGWQAINFALRFLTTLEQKYSINELELLAVV